MLGGEGEIGGGSGRGEESGHAAEPCHALLGSAVDAIENDGEGITSAGIELFAGGCEAVFEFALIPDDDLDLCSEIGPMVLEVGDGDGVAVGLAHAGDEFGKGGGFGEAVSLGEPGDLTWRNAGITGEFGGGTAGFEQLDEVGLESAFHRDLLRMLHRNAI